MSHKIKIDLCEVFGVKEGQEFKIDESGWKYKIENNNLFSYSPTCLIWAVSSLPVNVLVDNSHQIEILKPETPPEIKKMLQGFYDMGFRSIIFEWGGWYLVGKDICISQWSNYAFEAWVSSLPKPDGNDSYATFKIKDYI